MIHLQTGLYVSIEQLDTPTAPRPLPLISGFSEDSAYLVLGVYSPSETSEAYFILSNDRDELWFISNRHLRTHALVPEANEFRRPRGRLKSQEVGKS